MNSSPPFDSDDPGYGDVDLGGIRLEPDEEPNYDHISPVPPSDTPATAPPMNDYVAWTPESLVAAAIQNGHKRPDAEKTAEPLEVVEARFDLAQFALNGQSKRLEEQMLEDKFVLGRLAILGQLTDLYAKPNSGKTLMVIWLLIQAIKSGQIDAEDVFYINADDNFRGLVFKLKLAEQYGYMQLAPGFNDFKSDLFLRYLQKMIEEQSARGKVVILDTLKKFTDVMDKKVATGFGKVAREFVSSGGTIIMLAHTNKHRDADGQLVFSGTSDVVDDADCVYMLDVIDGAGDSERRTVVFKNIKARGDVDSTATYSYSTAKGQSYSDLLESVMAVSGEQAEEARMLGEVAGRLQENSEVIEEIIAAIDSGVTLKTELVNAVKDTGVCSAAKVRKVLNQHTGTDYLLGHRWNVKKGDKNAMAYQLLLSTKVSPQSDGAFDYRAAKGV